jgi:hypothetical protein
MGHVLGVGTADSWDALIDPDLLLFNGAQSVASFGAQVPVDPYRSHWQDDAACSAPMGYDPENERNVLSRTYVSFGTDHGVDQIALMDPSSCTITNNTTLKVFTDLDIAALSDIGWQVVVPLELSVPQLGPALSSLSWPSTTGETYTLQRTSDLNIDWTNLVEPTNGDGSLMSYSDMSPPASGMAFYRLQRAPTASIAAAPLTQSSAAERFQAQSGDSENYTKSSRVVEGCAVHERQ